jgi:hypothetical protein
MLPKPLSLFTSEVLCQLSYGGLGLRSTTIDSFHACVHDFFIRLSWLMSQISATMQE